MTARRGLVPRPDMLGYLIAAIVAAVLYAWTGFDPPQSEDWIHLEVLAGANWLDAFDMQITKGRPLWFWPLWCMLPSGLEHPELLRIPHFVMHALIGGSVGVLARVLGASPRRALLATVLFLCFPAVKGVSWIVAISTPEHVLLMLLAMVAAASHAQRPRAATGLALVVTQVLAVGCHGAAVLLPACTLVLMVGVAPAKWRIVTERWVVTHLLVGAALLLVLTSLPAADRHHSMQSLAAMAANGARALLSLLPETVRWPAIEGLRGAFGWPGLVFGGGVCAATAGAFAWMMWRADGVVRGLLLAAAIDLAPPAMTAGFVVRYAYFPAALVAAALLLAAKPTRTWGVALGLLGVAWAYDHAVDVAEVRRGAELGRAVIASARAVRAEAGPGVSVVLVDPPGLIGAERDVFVFNWGLQVALRRNGVDGPWQLLRTQQFVTNSDLERVDEARLAQLTTAGLPVWRWDAEQSRFLRR